MDIEAQADAIEMQELKHLQARRGVPPGNVIPGKREPLAADLEQIRRISCAPNTTNAVHRVIECPVCAMNW